MNFPIAVKTTAEISNILLLFEIGNKVMKTMNFVEVPPSGEGLNRGVVNCFKIG